MGGVPGRARDRHPSIGAGGSSHPGPRTVRVRRGVRAPSGEGPLLIRAVVHARLFGLRLLTLDARVVVAESDPIEPVLEAVGDIDPTIMPLTSAEDRHSERQGIGDLRATRLDAAPEPNGGVAQARELLAQGADTLAGLRRHASY
jgi:hypothetical protein